MAASTCHNLDLKQNTASTSTTLVLIDSVTLVWCLPVYLVVYLSIIPVFPLSSYSCVRCEKHRQIAKRFEHKLFTNVSLLELCNACVKCSNKFFSMLYIILYYR